MTQPLEAGSSIKPTAGSDQGAKALRELYLFMGNGYALLQGAVRNEAVGLYTLSAAVKDRLQEIEGSGEVLGRISLLEKMLERVDDVIDGISKMSKEELERASRGGYSDSEMSDGGVSTEPAATPADKYFGGSQ